MTFEEVKCRAGLLLLILEMGDPCLQSMIEAICQEAWKVVYVGTEGSAKWILEHFQLTLHINGE
jgi:hypothetical protein